MERLTLDGCLGELPIPKDLKDLVARYVYEPVYRICRLAELVYEHAYVPFTPYHLSLRKFQIQFVERYLKKYGPAFTYRQLYTVCRLREGLEGADDIIFGIISDTMFCPGHFDDSTGSVVNNANLYNLPSLFSFFPDHYETIDEDLDQKWGRDGSVGPSVSLSLGEELLPFLLDPL